MILVGSTAGFKAARVLLALLGDVARGLAVDPSDGSRRTDLLAVRLAVAMDAKSSDMPRLAVGGLDGAFLQNMTVEMVIEAMVGVSVMMTMRMSLDDCTCGRFG